MSKPTYTVHDLARAIAAIDPLLAHGLDWQADNAETLREATRRFRKAFHAQARAIVLDGRIPDPVTGLTYCPDVASDRNAARKRALLHALFETLHPEARLYPYSQREKRKQQARHIVADKTQPLADRLDAARQVIAMHYARSAASSLRNDDPLSFVRHPGLAEYTAHYLHADIEHVRAYFKADVCDALLAEHPAPAVLYIAPGCSYWEAAPISAARIEAGRQGRSRHAI